MLKTNSFQYFLRVMHFPVFEMLSSEKIIETANRGEEEEEDALENFRPKLHFRFSS
jgi:hypothetical protein